MDGSPSGSPVPGILQARTLEWVAFLSPMHESESEVTQLCPTLRDRIDCNPPLVQFSRSVMSDSLRPHELQHTRPPCPSPTPRVYSNSCPSSRWCHPAILSSVIPFSSCPQSLPASGSFPMSQLFAWCNQSIGVLASASVLRVTQIQTSGQCRDSMRCRFWVSIHLVTGELSLLH